MKIELLTEVTLSAKPEEVWKILTNFSIYNDWNPFITSITGRLAVGEKLTVEIIPPGLKKQVFTPTLINLVRNREIRWVGKLLFHWLFRGEHYFRLEKIDSNRTRLVHGEIFSGCLVRLFRHNLKGATLQGFQSMNKSLAAQVKHGLSTSVQTKSNSAGTSDMTMQLNNMMSQIVKTNEAKRRCPFHFS